ncbi:MAG: exodeoxyribonuclease VII small subunit [Ignavibacteria bacterium]|nr:exodeoxyribonuclease VII small subunit [Ignavibacteria bacterium]
MEQTFESKLKRLQEIVGLLESGNVTLEESLNLYEEGMKLASELKKVLDDAELKIIRLNENFSNSNMNQA